MEENKRGVLPIKMYWVLALGIFLRVLYFLKPRSFWGDEWFTIFLSQKPLKDVLTGALHDVHPPLQFLLFHFGGYRLWPFLAGVASLYFFSKLSKDRLATFLFAISPYFMHLCAETRGYGFLCLFTILALCGFRWAFIAALATEHYAWFLLLAVPLALWFIPFLTASLGLMLFQSRVEQAFLSNRLSWDLAGLFKKIVGLFIQFGGGVKYSFLTFNQARSLWKAPYLLFFLGPVVFLFFARDRKYWKLFLVPIIVLLVFYPIRLNARYIPFCAVSFLMLACMGYKRMRQRHRIGADLILVSFIIANIFSLAWLFQVNYDPYHREDYIQASRFIEKHITVKDGLIGCRDQVAYYVKKNYPEDGEIIWEVYLGNPDMKINEHHWQNQQQRLERTKTFLRQFGDLVWVVKYEKNLF